MGREGRVSNSETAVIDEDAPIYDDEIYRHSIYSDRKEIPFLHLHPLGEGGFGFVDKVERRTGHFQGRVYARKLINMMCIKRDSIENEVNLIKRARHIHVVCVTETYVCGRDFAIIMTPVAEGNLQEFLHDVDQLPHDDFEGKKLRNRILPWFGCLVNGSNYLHSLGISHRDIKPQNILITAQKILLTDFGIAIQRQEETRLTETETLGTVRYHAPELATWSPIRPGRPGDIFSLGAVFLEMFLVASSLFLEDKRSIDMWGSLAGFRDFCETDGNRSYAKYLDRVECCLESLLEAPTESSLMLLNLCFLMLRGAGEREKRPSAQTLSLCWLYQPFLKLPSTSCRCSLLESTAANQSDSRIGYDHSEVFGYDLRQFLEILGKAPPKIISINDPTGQSMLHKAVVYGHTDVARHLLALGAAIDLKDRGGWTPLHWATEYGYEGTARLLLEAGAAIEARDRGKWTPLHWAADAGHASVVLLLLDKGANVEAKDKEGQTALHWASDRGRTEVVKLLLNRGANAKCRNKDSITPLQSAAFSGHSRVLELLLDSGADPNAQDKDEWTALRYAVNGGQNKIVWLLLATKRADTSLRGKDGTTAMQAAAGRGHERIVQMLRDYEEFFDFSA